MYIAEIEVRESIFNKVNLQSEGGFPHPPLIGSFTNRVFTGCLILHLNIPILSAVLQWGSYSLLIRDKTIILINPYKINRNYKIFKN